jgi:hypothetical protein
VEGASRGSGREWLWIDKCVNSGKKSGIKNGGYWKICSLREVASRRGVRDRKGWDEAKNSNHYLEY